MAFAAYRLKPFSVCSHPIERYAHDMAKTFEFDTRRAIRAAMALRSYETDTVRLTDTDIADHDWLVATHRGLYAVNLTGAKRIIYGWFFGICRNGQDVYLFENCAMRDRTRALGRVIKMTISSGNLSEPVVLIKGLAANCHQIEVIDGLLCVVDTANQSILRYTLNGSLIDTKKPFPIAPASDRKGAYLHINSIAKTGDRIALMLHNGPALPEKCSELAWLDAGWKLTDRVSLNGYCCHDIVEDENGVLWHSASSTGELMANDGRRIKITSDRMTRGIALSIDTMIVGLSSFGARQNRDALPGAVVILDRALNKLAEFELGGPPADIVAI